MSASMAITSAKTTLALAAALFVLAACTPPQQVTTDAGSSPPPVAGRVPTDYQLLNSSAAARPDWVLNIPDDADGQHYLVALSEYHASEQDARDTALKNARKEYANYTGVEVSDVDEVIRAMYGSSSDVFDPTVAGRNKTTQKTEAQVSRIKAKQWYYEKYQASRGNLAQGQVFKYWVLVSVPLDEYDRVQTWKRQKIEDQLAREKKLEDAAEAELTRQLQIHREKLAEIQKVQAGGDPVSSLSLIKMEWDRLFEAEGRFKNLGGPYLARIDRLEDAQRTVANLVGRIRSAIQIDCGRSSSLNATQTTGDYPLPAWACAKTPTGTQPLPNLPLTISAPDGTVLARSVTDRNGRGEFHLDQLAPGRYRIGLDLNDGILATLDKGIATSLNSVENHIVVTPAASDFEASIHNAVALLFATPNQNAAADYRVILGPVTYGPSRQGTELSLEVQRQLREDLTHMHGLTVIEPRPRTTNVVSQAVTRGIAIQTSTSAPSAAATPNLGSASFQAVIDGAEAALETSYGIQGETLKFDMTLREAGTDKLLAATSIPIPRSAIPGGIAILPATAPPPPPPLATSMTAPIRLQVTSHLGDGQTYREGETISYFVNTDRDAYLLLIYQDAANNLIQILPNRYSGNGFYRAGNLLQIPAPSDRFEFVITAPFGTEKVWAFAASRPFARLSGQELENGLTLLSGQMNSIVQTLRRSGQVVGSAYGEAQAVITTVAKP